MNMTAGQGFGEGLMIQGISSKQNDADDNYSIASPQRVTKTQFYPR